MSQLSIYKASAGSGKTFQLTLEYLVLVIANPYNYKRILGVTFTNKASAEMKGRILEELKNIAAGRNSKYLPFLENILKINRDEISNKAKTALSKLLHDYSRFSISTIDTFFQKILKGFVKEIKLLPVFTLELNEEDILKKATDELFNDLEEDSVLMQWLSDFVQNNIEEEKSWNIKKEILNLGREVFKERFKLINHQYNIAGKTKKELSEYIHKLQNIRRSFEHYYQELGEEAFKIIQTNNLDIEDFKYKDKGPAGYFIKIKNKDFVPTTRVLNGAESPDEWISKSSDKKEIMTPVVENHLMELTNKGLEYYDEHFSIYNTAQSILKNIHTLGIMSDLLSKIQTYCNENNLFLLSDTGYLINKIIDNNEIPFIYEKTGSVYRHFMIDEFQDTSEIQYLNFKPLMSNSLAEGGKNFIVGDIKQSIYRWRNSSWKILASDIYKDFPGNQIKESILKYNRRSNKTIVSYCNSVFQDAARILQEEINKHISNQEEKELSSFIENAYGEAIQHLPDNKKDTKGKVEHHYYTADHVNEYDTLLKKELYNNIIRLKEQGYRNKDIAILVRTGNEGEKIVKMLIEYQQMEERGNYDFSFISNDSLFLDNSGSVSIILQVMKYLIDPEDEINLYNLAFNYLSYHQNRELQEDKKGEIFENIKKNKFRYLPDNFQESISMLTKLTIFEISETIIDSFELSSEKNQIPYLMSFQDSVMDYLKTNNGGINTFLEWWETNKSSRKVNLSEDQDGIRVLTIHKSKGLEFKNVIVPYCHWKLETDGSKGNFLWCSPDRQPFNKLDVVPVKYAKELNQTIFAEEYLNEKAESFVDNLNLLYVAFTRAEDQLFIYSREKSKNEQLNAGSLLKNIYSKDNGETIGRSNQYPRLNITEYWNQSDSLIIDQNPGQQVRKEQQAEPVTEYDYKVYEKSQSIRIKHHGEDFFDISEYPADRYVIKKGNILHEIFENITHVNDLEKALVKISNEGKIEKSEIEDYTRHVSALIHSNEHTKNWFCDEWEVKTEAEIILTDGKVIRPDRVMIGDEQVIIIDYKFGETESKSHINQVLQYKHALSEMGYNNVEGYLWYAEINKIVNV